MIVFNNNYYVLGSFLVVSCKTYVWLFLLILLTEGNILTKYSQKVKDNTGGKQGWFIGPFYQAVKNW